MTTDIVERLRMQAIDTGIEDIAREAADAIERLCVNLGGARAALKMTNDEIERLQAELHQFEEQLAEATGEIAYLRSANANRE